MPLYIIFIITIFYLLIFITCLINIINPRYLWKLFEGWKATSEPTVTYFKMTRFVSIIGLIVVTLIMLAPLLLFIFDK